VVKGEPRSLVKTNGEDGFCFRLSRPAPEVVTDDGIRGRRAFLRPNCLCF